MKKIELPTKHYFFSIKSVRIILSVFCVLCLLSFKVAHLNIGVSYSVPFSVIELDRGNLLNWKTSAEQEVAHFQVEKSTDGINFKNFETIESDATKSGENEYWFFDTHLGVPKSYYRLKIVANDGASSYSQVIVMNKQQPNQLAVVAYSNVRVKSNFDLSLDSVIEGQLEYALINSQGKLISEEFQYLYPGLNELQISLENLPSGHYKVVLKMDEEEESLFIYKENEAQQLAVSSKKIVANLLLNIGQIESIEGVTRIFNSKGHKIKESYLADKNKPLNINISDFESGMYYLIIEATDGKIIESQFTVPY